MNIYSPTIIGNTILSGSLSGEFAQITGSLSGNGSGITGIVSASYAISASYVPTTPAVSSSYAATASISQIYDPATISAGELGETVYAWNPAGLDDASLVLLSGTSSYTTLGGIAGNYKTLTLLNTGSYTVCLTANDASASAAHRFLIREDVNLFQNDSVTLTYDSINSGWRLLGGTSLSGINSLKQQRSYWQINSIISTTHPDGWIEQTNGTPGRVAASTTEPAWWTISTGTTTTGGAYLQRGYWQDMSAAPTPPRPHLRFKAVIKIPILSDGTNTFKTTVGLCSADGVSITAVFTYTHSVNSGKFRLETVDGTYTADSGVTVSSSEFYLLEIFYRPNNVVSFYINGNTVGDLQGVSSNKTAASFLGITKSAGTTNRQLYIASIEQIETRV